MSFRSVAEPRPSYNVLYPNALTHSGDAYRMDPCAN